MKDVKYEQGDQVEARLIAWYTPGEHLLTARTAISVWRGDHVIASDVGKRNICRSVDELVMMAGLFSTALWTRFEGELWVPLPVSPDLGDAPGPVVV